MQAETSALRQSLQQMRSLLEASPCPPLATVRERARLCKDAAKVLCTRERDVSRKAQQVLLDLQAARSTNEELHREVRLAARPDLSMLPWPTKFD